DALPIYDGDDGRAQLELRGVEVLLVDDLAFDGPDLEVHAELVGDELRGRWVEQFVDRRHDAELEQRLDHLARLPPHLLGELAHRDGLGYPDELALHLGRRGWRRLDGGSRTGRRGRRRRGLGGARRRGERRAPRHRGHARRRERRRRLTGRARTRGRRPFDRTERGDPRLGPPGGRAPRLGPRGP